VTGDVRDLLVAEVDTARADLERAVRRLDAVDVLATLAAGVDADHCGDLDSIEQTLGRVDLARWRNALRDAVDTEPVSQDPVDTVDENTTTEGE
jgi:hypothetical protein